MMNIRTFKKELATMKKGDRFYLNAISCSVSVVEHLKQLIIEGYLQPDPQELKKAVKENAIETFEKGWAIFPQMTYIVIRGFAQ